MTVRDHVVPVVLEKVYQLIQDKLETAMQVTVKDLAQHLFSNVSYDDLYQRKDSDLYGAILSLWHHINQSNPDNTSVRVFNPTIRQHGWQSTHTIIEIVMTDSPFQVDSIKMALSRLGLSSHLMLNSPTMVERDKDNRIISVNQAKGTLTSLFHIEIDRLSDEDSMQALKSELLDILSDTLLVVNDWQAMSSKLAQVVEELEQNQAVIPMDDKRFDETIAFLKWALRHNFTFMGYKEYDLQPVDGDVQLTPTAEPGLGLFARVEHVHTVALSQLSDLAKQEARKPYALITTKGNRPSRIHRPAYNDYIGIKKFNSQGEVVGEHRFTGLYTSAVYNQTVSSIPLIRDKVERTLAASGYLQGSYAYKAMHNILENYPRDELLQASEDELLEVGMGVVQMQDRDLLRLFVRKDPFGRFFSCMVYVTKDRYNTELRRHTQRLFKSYFKSTQDVEFTTYFSESSLARTHYIVRVEDNNFDIDIKEIEHNLMEVSSTWDDRLTSSLISHYGESQGLPLAKSYAMAFPRSYKEDILPSSAVDDIQRLENLDDENKLGMLFYRPQELGSNSQAVRLKLYHRDEPIHLSDVMPMLENLGLRVIGESPYEIHKADGQTFWILDFSMLHKGSASIDFDHAQERFQQAFAEIWNGKLESDGFNKLLLGAAISGRDIAILRAYARYMRQLGFPFSQQYIEETLNHYPNVASNLVALFHRRFEPKYKGATKGQQLLIQQINQQLEAVDSLDDDRIIRRYMEMIEATVRTNYFQTLTSGESKPTIAFKMTPRVLADIPQPIPEFEIFVYSPDIEGVHLRGGKVARGGLRWSDRQEDFRTEILGLVKAQQVKNTVIVPVGAKGGFVCKKQPGLTQRDEILAEGKRCYQLFIRSLLDVTDNIVESAIVAPKQTVRHDDDDPYLVVAADKGTATFSDLANGVAEEFGFWLGDAFASGGSNGYDHKAMGITAKGGWESVKRHFREMGIDCQTNDFTVIGVGDMAGDVFGNGMLLSKHIRLQAAFNHLHIFIDPNPDAASSWQERKRLFELPRSSWEDYNHDLISQGGGVFSRRAKSIALTSEMQKMLNTKRQKMSPNELIQKILTMDADLLWNGGIGTYVKSSKESHTDVGDRANDVLRVDGKDLKVKVVGEGGNLGLTQLGRVEFALNGGRVNTDFVDNVGGVDCSDNEVNIKILLNTLVSEGELTVKKRNQILESMEDEVGEIVLEDAYQQSESISVTEQLGTSTVKEQIRFIHNLEKQNFLDRALENLPDDEALLEREKLGMGLTRPELSVLVAYSKMLLKQQLCCDEIASDAHYQSLLNDYFPELLQQAYPTAIQSHPLKNEIIATVLANQIVNIMGFTFVARLHEETGASIVDIAKAYSAALSIFGFDDILTSTRALDNKATTQAQYQVFYQSRRSLRRLTRWLLRNRNEQATVQQTVDVYKADVTLMVSSLDDVIAADEVTEHNDYAHQWIEQGIESTLAHRVSRLSSLQSALDVSEIAKQANVDVEQTAKLYFHLGHELSLHWFLNQINRQPVENYWQALARSAFREDLDWQQRLLTTQVLQCHEEGDVIADFERWVESNQASIERWNNILNEFKVGSTHEFAKFSVALRELALLNLNCMRNT